MIPREEFEAAVHELEDAVTKMALLVMTFRRLQQRVKSEDAGKQKPDFDYMTGQRPEEKG